ncbi:hypothetical protein EBR04_10140, partial [bacterium]|nr:hypothetical protein [bacterium]
MLDVADMGMEKLRGEKGAREYARRTGYFEAVMSIIEAITLGIVQGLTEFLPISSTAHLRIVPALCGWADPGAAYSAVIQCGTLAAVCVALRHDIVRLARGFVAGLRSGRPFADADARTSLLVILGTLPIVGVGFAARHLIRGEARRLEVVTGALLFTTFLMAAAEWIVWRRARRGVRGRDGLEAVTPGDGLAMGLAQVLALVPGTSRSGVTISSGMLIEWSRTVFAGGGGPRVSHGSPNVYIMPSPQGA